MPLLSDPKLVPTILPLYFSRKKTTDFQGPKRARRDEQMRNGWQFSLLNDQQMSNEVGVEHQPVFYKNMRSAIFIGSLDAFLAELHLSKGKRKKWYPSFVYNRNFIPWLFFQFCWNLEIKKLSTEIHGKKTQSTNERRLNMSYYRPHLWYSPWVGNQR